MNHLRVLVSQLLCGCTNTKFPVSDFKFNLSKLQITVKQNQEFSLAMKIA